MVFVIERKIGRYGGGSNVRNGYRVFHRPIDIQNLSVDLLEIHQVSATRERARDFCYAEESGTLFNIKFSSRVTISVLDT